MVKYFLAVVTGLVFLCSSFAVRAENGYFKSEYFVSDTSDNNDSLREPLVPVRDAKKEFEEFTFTSTLPLGIDADQLNPQAISFVKSYVEKNAKRMDDLRDWGRPYFVMMDDILDQYSLPHELKYLAVIESFLKSNARSRAGAVGPWQFMPATARNMGLTVTRKVDERKDFVKSTHAASKYLQDLYELYGDWLLVIAAYNGGPGKVDAAIRRSGSRDFWTLQRYLPLESMNHVKKFIATHYMLEGQGGITTATKAEAAQFASQQALNATDTVNSKSHTISGRYTSAVIIKQLEVDIATFNRLNPNFDRAIASNGRYELRLPNDKMDLFLQKKPAILDECMQALLSQVGN